MVENTEGCWWKDGSFVLLLYSIADEPDSTQWRGAVHASRLKLSARSDDALGSASFKSIRISLQTGINDLSREV